jgi:hypothetical protein
MRIGHREHGALGDRIVGVQRAFDLDRRDVLATDDDDVLRSVEPVRVEPADVAGVEPAVEPAIARTVSSGSPAYSVMTPSPGTATSPVSPVGSALPPPSRMVGRAVQLPWRQCRRTVIGQNSDCP